MTSHRRRGAEITAGLTALLALTALTAGLPVALYLVAGSPLPHAVPALHQITATLGRRDDGTVFLAVVRYLGWIAWAAWTLSAAAEAYGQARGRQVPRLAGLGGMQQLSRSLITAIVIAFSSAPAAGLPAVTVAAATAAAPWPAAQAAAGCRRPGTGRRAAPR